MRPSLYLHSFERLGNKICEMETNACVCLCKSLDDDQSTHEGKKEATNNDERNLEIKGQNKKKFAYSSSALFIYLVIHFIPSAC